MTPPAKETMFIVLDEFKIKSLSCLLEIFPELDTNNDKKNTGTFPLVEDPPFLLFIYRRKFSGKYIKRT